MASSAKARGSSSTTLSNDDHEEEEEHQEDWTNDETATESLRIEPVATQSRSLYRTASHVSGPDTVEPENPPLRAFSTSGTYREVGDEIYERFSRKRKIVILVVMSYCCLLSPISSTTILAAIPEVAVQYHTSGPVIDLSNSIYMIFMGVSPIVWGPISQVFGRRMATIVTAVLFLLLSLATALAPDLASFFVFRALSALFGTAFILLGAACLSDIYRPVERGSAIGWYMTGSLIGPAFGPFVGGVIVTYSSWRTVFWLQTAMAGIGLLAVLILVPETIHHKAIDDLTGYSRKEKAAKILGRINPIRVIKLFRYPNLVMATVGSACLVWNMYSLLTPIRYVLNPRFHLQSPMLSSLFYLAPGCGYLAGTLGGGRWADWTVKKWIRKRGGKRIPEDRLRASMPFMAAMVPGCILIYGWAVDKAVGGVPVPVIMMFFQGVGQLFCFPALNTYCLDVMPGRGAEATAANFFIRYLMGCLGTAVVLPVIDAVGVGWFSTISAVLIELGALGTLAAIKWGPKWRENIDLKRKAARKQKRSGGAGLNTVAQSNSEDLGGKTAIAQDGPDGFDGPKDIGKGV